MRAKLALAAAVLCCAVLGADTNELERAKAAYIEARRAYMAARKAAGMTNAVQRARVNPNATTFTKQQRTFFRNRRICVSRDTESVPGSVITTWYRNGKPDTLAPAVVTNVLHGISGAVQDNPLQARVAALTEQYQAAIQRATSAEARAARADALKTWLEEQRDKSPLQTTKKIYQAIIDRLEENQ